MDKQRQMAQIRMKKLGLLIYDARRAARRSPQECAEAVGVPLDEFLAIEKGNKSLSLPELENLAFYLDVPLDHFWGRQSLSARTKPENIQQKEQLRKLRDRVIGASLRDARNKSGLSLEQVSESASVTAASLKQYELGSCPAPLTDLEALANVLKLRIEDLIDKRGPVGKWRAERVEFEKFMGLDPDMRQFICAPVNSPYITLAKRLSQMSVEKLRSIAETLLEITY
jgi:transcriptional regulator with XRE-family HTH domain